jgi:hypothetical protein
MVARGQRRPDRGSGIRRKTHGQKGADHGYRLTEAIPSTSQSVGGLQVPTGIRKWSSEPVPASVAVKGLQPSGPAPGKESDDCTYGKENGRDQEKPPCSSS